MDRLYEMNGLDLELFEFAKKLVIERQNIAESYVSFKMSKYAVKDIVGSVAAANDFFSSLANGSGSAYCANAPPASATTLSLPGSLNITVGLFQTPGHKGPNPEDASIMLGI